jgi:hypothetical protein
MRGKRRIDLTGQKFGRLVVVEGAGVGANGDALWRCNCNCGNSTIARAGNLRSKTTLSCGCLKKEIHTVHGGLHSPEYTIWEGMIQRCTNKNAHSYKRYGGKGVSVCEKWRQFANFLKDMGKRPDGLTLDRWPNRNGNYEPNNCRWASVLEQNHNLRIYKTNTTGVNGVGWNKKNKKYQAAISVNNKTKHLGLFIRLEDAREARKQGEIKYWGKERGL